MKRSDLICQIIIKSGLAKTYPQAVSLFVQCFIENFRQKSLDHWDTEVPAELAQKFIREASAVDYSNLHRVISDLEIFLKKSKLSLLLLLTWQLILQAFQKG
jgi:hypothetical protein